MIIASHTHSGLREDFIAQMIKYNRNTVKSISYYDYTADEEHDVDSDHDWDAESDQDSDPNLCHGSAAVLRCFLAFDTTSAIDLEKVSKALQMLYCLQEELTHGPNTVLGTLDVFADEDMKNDVISGSFSGEDVGFGNIRPLNQVSGRGPPASIAVLFGQALAKSEAARKSSSKKWFKTCEEEDASGGLGENANKLVSALISQQLIDLTVCLCRSESSREIFNSTMS